MSKEAKMIRGQVRQIAKEMLNEEQAQALYEKVLKAVEARLSKIEANVKETLTLLDKRSKDIAGYLVRQSSLPTPPGQNVIPAPKDES